MREEIDMDAAIARHPAASRPPLDITGTESPVQVDIRSDGTVMWVHVDGLTVLRICRIHGGVLINDMRPKAMRITQERAAAKLGLI